MLADRRGINGSGRPLVRCWAQRFFGVSQAIELGIFLEVSYGRGGPVLVAGGAIPGQILRSRGAQGLGTELATFGDPSQRASP